MKAKAVNTTQTPELTLCLPGTQAEAVKTAEPKQNNVYYIEPTTEVEIHELAAALPIMEGEDFEDFKKNIQIGQQTPIIMDGKILLDGRNRLKACQELNIAVKAIQWHGKGTAEELIIALNLHRRHLTAGQRAAFAVKLLPALEKQAAQRRGVKSDGVVVKLPQSPKSVDLAGAQAGVSGKYVGMAKNISAASSDTFKKLLNGTLTLAQANKEIKKTTEPSPAPDPIRCSLEEALKKIIRLVPGESRDALIAIAQEAPQVVKKAIQVSCQDKINEIKSSI